MKLKRIVALVLVLVMVLSVAAASAMRLFAPKKKVVKNRNLKGTKGFYTEDPD